MRIIIISVFTIDVFMHILYCLMISVITNQNDIKGKSLEICISIFSCLPGQVMLLRNHGVVCCGESIEEAWYNTYHTILACETQVSCLVGNVVLVFMYGSIFTYFI